MACGPASVVNAEYREQEQAELWHRLPRNTTRKWEKEIVKIKRLALSALSAGVKECNVQASQGQWKNLVAAVKEVARWRCRDGALIMTPDGKTN